MGGDLTVTERHFIRFIEKNEHEGETWSSWLQLTGNEEELARLRTLVDPLAEPESDDLEYALTHDIEPEWAVDLLVEYANDESTYAPAHRKITGKFTCPDDLGEHAENIYKGGVKDFFTREYSEDAPGGSPVPARRGMDARTWDDIITVLRYVSGGVGYTRTAGTLYPDAQARRALGALRDYRRDVPGEST